MGINAPSTWRFSLFMRAKMKVNNALRTKTLSLSPVRLVLMGSLIRSFLLFNDASLQLGSPV